MNYRMKILGIDPGIARMGWGTIEVESSTHSSLRSSGREFKVQNYGCIETAPKLAVEQRLNQIHQSLIKIIEEYRPEAMAVEELFFNTNAKTAFVVGQARGVILLTGAQKKIPVFIYTPLQVKVALTGYGRAEKPQVGQMVKTILKLKEIPKPDDTADALAIALCHAFSHKSNMLNK